MNNFSAQNKNHVNDSTNSKFDFIAITLARITKSNAPINNIALRKYSYKHCPTKSSAGGTLLYIKSHLLF